METQGMAADMELCPGAPNAWKPTEADIAALARICHDANRAFCIVNGDLSQPTWEEAPDWQKESAMEGVKFHLATPFATGRDSHDKWMDMKLRDGWRYGPTKDAAAKVHPCLLPYCSLPADQKLKDDLFIAIVRGYAQAKRSQ